MSQSQGTSVPAVFNFQSHQVRTVFRNGEVWFVASDVCKALGYQNTSKAVGDHLDDDERATESIPTPNALLGVPTNIISESGLYALVLRSRKPEARKFAKWVTSEVLPAIRKTGGYQTPDVSPAPLRRWTLCIIDGQPSIAPMLPEDIVIYRPKLVSWLAQNMTTREANEIMVMTTMVISSVMNKALNVTATEEPT